MVHWVFLLCALCIGLLAVIRLLALHIEIRDGYIDVFELLDEEELRKIDAHDHPEHARQIVMRRRMIGSSTPAILTMVLLLISYLSVLSGVEPGASTFWLILTGVALIFTGYRVVYACVRARRVRVRGVMRHSSS